MIHRPGKPGTYRRAIRRIDVDLHRFEAIALASHRDLVTRRTEVAERLNAAPALGVMFFINPVLALQRLGVSVSPEIARHILHTLQHPKALRQRRDELEARLNDALGETPRPGDPAWNADLLFGKLRLAPLEIGSNEPAFKSPLADAMRDRLYALRPVPRPRYRNRARKLQRQARVGTVPWSQALRRLDLDSAAPRLPVAREAPAAVPLEDLWFYKDLDPIVRDVLQLGIIQRRAFPFRTPDSFRQIEQGAKPNAFRNWIREVRFKLEPR